MTHREELIEEIRTAFDALDEAGQHLALRFARVMHKLQTTDNAEAKALHDNLCNRLLAGEEVSRAEENEILSVIEDLLEIA